MFMEEDGVESYEYKGVLWGVIAIFCILLEMWVSWVCVFVKTD